MFAFQGSERTHSQLSVQNMIDGLSLESSTLSFWRDNLDRVYEGRGAQAEMKTAVMLT